MDPKNFIEFDKKPLNKISFLNFKLRKRNFGLNLACPFKFVSVKNIFDKNFNTIDLLFMFGCSELVLTLSFLI
jgi:hypothetical protein